LKNGVLMDFEWWMGSALCLPAVILAALAGYLFGKESERKRLLTTESGAAMIQINQQLAEIKGKFQEIEKSREEREKFGKKLDDEKEKSWALMLENNKKNEQDRLGQIEKMVGQINQFQKIFLGTQSRGASAENVLRNYLKEQIKQGLVHPNLVLGDNLRVEFAWKLKDGKYLPIDSKCHDVLGSLEEGKADDVQQKAKKNILRKVQDSVDEVTKYQNLTKTSRYAIMAVPEAIYELAPEASHYAVSKNVYLTSFSNVPLIAYLIAEQYNSDLEKGDAKKLEGIVNDLLHVLEEIHRKTDTINKGLKTAQNANDDICGEISKAKKMN